MAFHLNRVSSNSEPHKNRMSSRRVLLFLFMTVFAAASVRPQRRMSTDQRDLANAMLNDVATDVRDYYYDPTFHGVDWSAKIRETTQKVRESTDFNMAMAHVAAMLDSLGDSHTYLVPPPRPYRIDFGYELAMIGERCFVVQVQPGSDAESRGVKAGDQLLALNGYVVDRDSLWRMDYTFRFVRPQPQLRLKLQRPNGQEYQETVAPRVKKLQGVVTAVGPDYEASVDKDFYAMRWTEFQADLMILKFPIFYFDESEISHMVGRAQKHKTLVIDLRGNGGGSEDTMKNLVGYVMDHDVKVCDLVGRGNLKPLIAKSKGKHVFTGKLVVLLDSRSASASEVFARVIQLEQRGVVLGDQSSGSVMRAKLHEYATGTNLAYVPFAASITDSDLIMGDGLSLEHSGVIPDEIILPSPNDLAANRDPVIARGAELAGVKLTPEAAGGLFPYKWPK